MSPFWIGSAVRRAGDHLCPLDGQMVIRPPHGGDAFAGQPDQARGIHVGELGAPKRVEFAIHGRSVTIIDSQNHEARKVGGQESKRPRGILAQAVQEPAIGLRDDQCRGAPTARTPREERHDFLVQTIGSVEKGDEGTGIDEDLPGQGLRRP